MLVAVVACLVSTWPEGVAHAQTHERITHYTTDIRIEPSGDLVITETIEYNFGAQERHGILRQVPVRLRYDDRLDRVYPFELIEVRASAGTPAQYKVSDIAGGKKEIRIGDPDREITGAHTYVITYRLENALNGFPDHDELYWNAVGHEWLVPIERASVTVTLPRAVAEGEARVLCFSGVVGSQMPCRAASVGTQRAEFAHAQMGAQQGVTVVVGFPKGLVPEPAPVLRERWSIKRAFTLDATRVAIAIALFAVVVTGIARLTWVVGRDRRWRGSPVDAALGSMGANAEEEPVAAFEDGPYPVEFTPPDGLRPGQVGTLVDEVAHPLDVSATVVDLAVRGYLHMEELEKRGLFGKPDWRLTRTDKPLGDDVLEYERRLLNGLFEDGSPVELSELKNKFAARQKEVHDALYEDLVSRGWYSSRPDSTRLKWMGLGFLALVASVAVFAGAIWKTSFALVPIPLILGSLVLIAVSGRMPSRTAKGTAALRRALGFRRFIETAEGNRARFAERANLFYEYLPFAIVFGEAERWARAFEGVTQQPPSWYGSRSGNAFSAVYLGEAMDGFATTSSTTLSSTPGGSGSSGFSGGGSSGGGGGGGGGGSW